MSSALIINRWRKQTPLLETYSFSFQQRSTNLMAQIGCFTNYHRRILAPIVADGCRASRTHDWTHIHDKSWTGEGCVTPSKKELNSQHILTSTSSHIDIWSWTFNVDIWLRWLLMFWDTVSISACLHALSVFKIKFCFHKKCTVSIESLSK